MINLLISENAIMKTLEGIKELRKLREQSDIKPLSAQESAELLAKNKEDNAASRISGSL